MTNKQELIEWINNASYRALLAKNRFGKMDDQIFIGEIGGLFMKTMRKRKEELTNEEQVSISKEIGWEY